MKTPNSTKLDPWSSPSLSAHKDSPSGRVGNTILSSITSLFRNQLREVKLKYQKNEAMKSNEELIAKITIHFLRPFRNRKEVHDALREVPLYQSDPDLSRL